MPTKDQEALRLAQIHYEVEPGLTHIYRIHASVAAEAMPDEPIKLLEVNRDTVASGIMPLGFGPSPSVGLHHPLVILEITPEEYERIGSAELKLPNGWEIQDLIPRPSVGANLQ